ncbi:hypothetical protein SLEP1_g39488 [Rubroshorea leprosula]|uniref:Secreted protein n=1 Tax=Rubroshorea leprosula TaxID=152421 RepID=A0AAV5L1I9_9ROSI|nr:hypothetical protein SLEP1_g39488 [Rubroshorea leprosula]
MAVFFLLFFFFSSRVVLFFFSLTPNKEAQPLTAAPFEKPVRKLTFSPFFLVQEQDLEP